MAVVVVVGEAWSLASFRGDLIRDLIAGGHRVVAVSAPAPSEHVDRIRALGADFRPVPILRNRLSPAGDLRTLRSLRALFSAVAPDVVLAYTAKAVIWSGFALRASPRTRFVALINGLGFTFQGEGVSRRALTMLTTGLYRGALRRAAAVVFQNRDNLETFVARSIVPREKCHVVDGSGVNLDDFAAAPTADGPARFLMMSRPLREKGLREFAAAARIVRARCAEASFQVLGREDRSMDAVPPAEIAAWQSEGLVDFVPTVDDVRPYLRDSHVCVLPSYHEGLPRSLLEGLAVARPILTTDVPGCRETVVTGENGFLVPKADAAALAERMIWFIDHRDCWPAMGRASRRLAETRFDVRTVNAAMRRILGLGDG